MTDLSDRAKAVLADIEAEMSREGGGDVLQSAFEIIEELLIAPVSKRVERLETADIERLARSAAVSAVDAIHGYTMEFAQSPANHRDEYDQAESAIRYELTRALGAPS